ASSEGWQPTGDMQLPRRCPGTVQLGDGTPLLIAGEIGPDQLTASAEYYDMASGTWLYAGSTNLGVFAYPLEKVHLGRQSAGVIWTCANS
ncbi:MAG TPA: kelch repeat-containing protein, partial [Candidatus Tectomicrobia bacterium]